MIDLRTPTGLVSFVSVDVETTGLDPAKDEIVEIGAVKVQGGQVVDQFSTLVCIDRTIPYGAQRVHKITNRMLVGQPRIDRAMGMLLDFAGDGALVEHSWKAFDIAFLENALGRKLENPCLNTCTLSRKLFPFHRKHSLEECCRRHGIIQREQHRALPDALATAQLLLYLLQTCASRYPCLRDLVTIASVER
jgi:DNA polymerase III epsilon subunit family exonuclease